jgi:predicted membrane channel-forming protein YqfA (hemolysin III family)
MKLVRRSDLRSNALYVDVLVPVNIHTHLHASILFAFFLRTFSNSYFKVYKDISWADYAVFGAFLSSACFCLFGSAFHHMSSSHSKQVSDLQPVRRASIRIDPTVQRCTLDVSR